MIEKVASPERRTPISIIEQARALVRADDAEGALALLQSSRDSLRKVPANYDAEIGRLLVRSGDPHAAVAHLATARARFGSELPAALRRAYAAALIAAGRIEAAGAEIKQLKDSGMPVVQPAWLHAIDAFDHRLGQDLDEGEPTPYRILAQAEAMTADHNKEGAAAILAAHRKNWDDVPPAYDTLLRRLEYETADRNETVARLTAERDACTGPVPAKLRQQLGTALFELSRIDEAGHELSLALDAGADVGRLGLRVAADTYRQRTGKGSPVDTTFGRAVTHVDYDRKVVYVSVPKNASTLLKASFAMNSRHREEYLASKQPVHDFFEGLLVPPVSLTIIMRAEYFRFTVLRDPLRRLLSAYLDKFVRRRKSRQPFLRRQQVAHIVQSAQAMDGIEYDPVRSISFEQFVRFLATASDAECNMHWMPQYRVVGTDLSVYNHVGKVERLGETLTLLEERFGWVAETNIESSSRMAGSHIVKYSDAAGLAEPWRALPAELDDYEHNMPVPARFYPPKVKRLVEERYKADVTLYAQA